MHKLKKSLWMIMFAAVLLLAGCVEGEPVGESESGGEGNESGSDRGEVFTIARSTDAEVMDPGNATSDGDMDIVWHIFDGLVKFKNDDLEVEPALATEWETSEDGLTWTFQLREDVTFHDGTEFNAEAVETSFMRIFDEDHPYYGMIQGSYSYTDYLLGDVLDEVVAVDDYTVEFRLNQKFAPFLTYMGYYSQFIVSPTALEEKGADFVNHPVGTGPFEFVNWQKGEYVELKKNEDYWGDVPEIDTLVFKVVPESSTRLMELQSGEVQAIKSLNPDQLPSIEENEELKLHKSQGTNLFHISINTTKEPFDDQRVRQALNYAVDVDRIVEHIFKGNAEKAINFLPPSVFSFDESTGSYEHNPEKAKELLAEAGYEDGFELELYSFQGARPYVSQPIQASELVAADLRDVGIDVEIVTNEWANHADIFSSLEHDLALHGWFDIGHPSNFLKTLGLEGANTGYESEELNQLALDALATYETGEQEEIYKELQQKLHEAAVSIPIAHNDYTAATLSNVEGFELDILGIVRAHDAKITE